MKYVVLWDARAEADLAAVWLAATDRPAVVRAATWFDNQLERSPLHLGESRASLVHRLAFHSPLGIEFRSDPRGQASHRASSVRHRLRVRALGDHMTNLPQPDLPVPDPGDKKFNSRLVAPDPAVANWLRPMAPI